MKILYYFWGENSKDDAIESFVNLGHTVTLTTIPFQNYDNDPVFISKFTETLCSDTFDCIFTFNYFPIISTVAESCGIKYICWVYDCPHLTLYSKTITNECNYIFVFDKYMYQQISALQPKHLFHMPLAVNTKRLDSLFAKLPSTSFTQDVSFVGSFYDENMFDQIQYLPEYLKGYLNAMIVSQSKVWGYNFIPELLDHTLVTELDKYITFDANDSYYFTTKNIYENMICKKITATERKKYLNLVSEHFALELYSGSDAKMLCPKANAHGFISYTDIMPVVFHTSKINLNITLRSISSGIPLRAMDIMGAGGFLLSNYQPELAEYFIEGTDWVCYEDEQDLLNKIEYYLSHDKERTEIAQNGRQQIIKSYTYTTQLSNILKLVM